MITTNEKSLNIGQYLSAAIRHFAQLLNHDLFSIDSFKYLEDGDIEVTYRVNGKRKPTLCKRVSQIAAEPKLLSCFSREDVFEIGLFHGRIMERKAINKKP